MARLGFEPTTPSVLAGEDSSCFRPRGQFLIQGSLLMELHFEDCEFSGHFYANGLGSSGSLPLFGTEAEAG
jgi:hypothetical protein